MRGDLTEPIVGPATTDVAPEQGRVVAPRLSRHLITLDDGHQVGVAVAGRGIPLVVVHGFSAEGILYAQTLSRLVDLGFTVIAIDTAGHGGTLGLPTGAANLSNYTDLLVRVLDHLGIEHAVLAGHSMGGRLVVELAAREPTRAVAVILLDAIVGDVWDNMVNVFRLCPPLLAAVGVTLVVDTLSTMPLFADPAQARKLGRLVAPTLIGHVRRPWRLLAPAVSILRSRGSRWMLERIAQERVPLFAIHGDRDFAVPLATSKAAARRAHGDLVVVHGGSHSWLLKDPESLPAIIQRLLQGTLGDAIHSAIAQHGLDPKTATDDELESAFLRPDALVMQLTPPPGDLITEREFHRRPRYRFSHEGTATVA